MALRDNLVAWWEMNETSGTREDAHGSYDLTDNNTVGYATGRQGNGADFESGNSEYLTANSDLGLAPTGDFSVGFWVKFETSSGAQNFFHYNNDDGASDMQAYLDLNVGGATVLRFVDRTENIASYTWSSKSDGTWYYVVTTFKHNTASVGLNIYINGAKVASATSCAAGSSMSENNFYIGCAQSINRFVDGVIDEFAVWSKELSQAEIYQLYNDGNGLSYAGTADDNTIFIPRVSFIM